MVLGNRSGISSARINVTSAASANSTAAPRLPSIASGDERKKDDDAEDRPDHAYP